MDLKRIRHALALAEEMNFIRAAQKVNLSQPAFSRSIQALELELGMPLFDRSKQGLAITAIGAEFLARARQLAREADNLQRDMALTCNGEMGQLRFGAGPVPAASLAQPLLRQLRKDRPGLRVALQVSHSRHLLDYLRNEEIEFFIGDTQMIPADAQLCVTPLTQMRGPFVCRSGHPLLTRPERSVRCLLQYGFASLTLPTAIRKELHRAAGLPPEQTLPIHFECDDVGLLKQLASEDDLILIIAHPAINKELADGTLVQLPVAGLPDVFAEVGIVQLRGRTLSPAAQWAISTLQQQVANNEGAA